MDAGKGHGVKNQGQGVKGQGHWGQKSYNGPIFIKLGGWMKGRVKGSKIKVTGSMVKVKVTGVKGQIMFRSASNLVGRCRKGSRGQKSRSRGQRSRSRSLGSKVK